MNSQSQPFPVAGPASSTEPRALRLAVLGHVKDGGGSVSSAHFQLCQALLEDGHELDLYAVPSFVPDPGYDSLRFHYVPVSVVTRIEGDFRFLPSNLRVFVHRMAGRSRGRRFCKHAMTEARSRHALEPYDAILFLGRPPQATIAEIPTVVWPQGAPQNELEAIRGLAKPITRVAGRSAYLQARLYYEVKDRFVWRWARRHRLVLASNAARRQAVRFGVAPERVCVAPYPVDLARFTPGSIPDGPVRQILCIGRLDPRKRVDLLVDAVAILASKRDDFRVDVIGRDGSLAGWSKFVENAGRSLPITYGNAIPQAEILERLHQADVVVQPSEREEFGSAVAEALACGVPVVTGPTNGTSEYVPDDGSASFDRYEPDSLADALERALALSRHPAARSACRAAAQLFAADRVAATIVKFIREIPC